MTTIVHKKENVEGAVMSAETVIRAAIPDADKSTIDHIIWGRTPFPFKALTPKSLFKAASAYRRACDRGVILCDLCHRIARENAWTCVRCNDALRGVVTVVSSKPGKRTSSIINRSMTLPIEYSTTANEVAA